MRHSCWHPSRANGSSVGFFGIVLGIIGFAIFPIVGVITFLIGCKIDEYISDNKAKRKIQEMNAQGRGIWINGKKHPLG